MAAVAKKKPAPKTTPSRDIAFEACTQVPDMWCSMCAETSSTRKKNLRFVRVRRAMKDFHYKFCSKCVAKMMRAVQ